MPRQFLKRICPKPHVIDRQWYLRVFGPQLTDPRLWCLQRRSVTGAFGAGLAICFVPLPVHLPLAAFVAIVWRLNVAAIFTTVWVVNPLTMGPVYYRAYRVGTAITGVPPHFFGFHLSWDWLQHGLGPMWKPFLVGCLACSIIFGVGGWLGLELLWRYRVLNRRYRMRRAASLT
jgi:uncharacterized protein